MHSNNLTICGAVNVALLEKADRLFRNDDAGVWVELLQNARRAGASLVEINIEEMEAGSSPCLVTVHDNGKGIDDFQALLTLGSSGWDGETVLKEDPAGMGFFSLCRSDVEVHSGNRYVNISPAAFLGRREARIQTSAEIVRGTRLRFTRSSTKLALEAALERVAEFYPLEIRLDGRVLDRHDFLEGSLYRETIDGIEVGFATAFPWNWTSHGDENWNFYGARIHEPFATFQGLLDKEMKKAPETIHARFNVLETALVRLQLPDRRGIIQDNFFQAFKRKACAAAYRFFHTQGQHALPFRNWREAKQLGVILPEAVAILDRWHAESRDDRVEPLFGCPTMEFFPDLSNVILADRWLTNAHTLEGALHSGAALPGTLYCEKPEWSGYTWYDRLPRITDTELFLDDVSFEDRGADRGERPTKIEMEVEMQEGPAVRRTRLPVLIHAVADDYGWLEFVAVRNSPWDNNDLTGPFSVHEFLIAATFCASDDFGECDSWNTQMDHYAGDIERVVNEYFRGPKATLLALLRGVINTDATILAEQLQVREIRFSRSPSETPSWTVDLS